MKHQDNFEILNKIDGEISKANQEKRKLNIQIEKLNNKLQNIERNLEYWLRQKRVFGKAQYGDPNVRKFLIQAGIESDDFNAKSVAYNLEQRGLTEKKDSEISDEVIECMILLDNNYRLKNKNSIDPLMGLAKRQDNNEMGESSNDN